MGKELEGATGALDQLRDRFGAVEEAGKRAVGEAKAEAKRQRQVLVNAALSSLSSLRTHLVATLSGLREDAAPMHKKMAMHAAAADHHGTKLAWNASQGRWALVSEGIMDHLVIRVNVPPIGVRGLHASLHDPSGAPSAETPLNNSSMRVQPDGSLPHSLISMPAIQGRPLPTITRLAPKGGIQWQSGSPLTGTVMPHGGNGAVRRSASAVMLRSGGFSHVSSNLSPISRRPPGKSILTAGSTEARAREITGPRDYVQAVRMFSPEAIRGARS